MLADRLEGLYEYFYKLSALCSIMMCKYIYMVFIELNWTPASHSVLGLHFKCPHCNEV